MGDLFEHLHLQMSIARMTCPFKLKLNLGYPVMYKQNNPSSSPGHWRRKAQFLLWGQSRSDSVIQFNRIGKKPLAKNTEAGLYLLIHSPIICLMNWDLTR